MQKIYGLTFFKQNENWLAALLLLGLCLLTYGNVFHHEFLMDDYPMLIHNQLWNNIDFLQLNPQTLHTQAYFRPITHILNSITYGLFGEKAFGYHAINLIFFYFASVALYTLLKKLLNDPFIIYLSCILFCIHPINGVLINYKNATGYSFLILSFLLSLLYVICRNGFISYFLGAGWFLLALLCHEIAMLYPLYLASILYFAKKENLRNILAKCLPSIVLIAVYCFYRTIFQGSGNSWWGKISLFHLSLTDFLASYAQLICWYVLKLISGQGILLIFDIPLTREKFLIWISGLLIALGMSLYFIFFHWKRNYKSFALSWVLIGFSAIGLGCFSRPNLGFIIEPHWLLFSSIGFFILLSAFLAFLKTKVALIGWRLFILVLCGYYLFQSYHHNYLWEKQERYCRYWLSISPNNYMPNFWLAFSYLENKEYAKSKEIYERLLKKRNIDPQVLGNIGVCEYYLGNYNDALIYLNQSMRLAPDIPDTYYYLGEVYYQVGDLKRAEDFLKQAYAKDQALMPALKALVKVYNKKGDKIQAAKMSEILLKKIPEDPELKILVAH